MLMVFSGFALAFVGVILLIGSFVELGKQCSFTECSEDITGQVGSRYFHHANNHRSYSMDVKYTVDGNEYKRSVPISSDEYHTLKEGDAFALKYKPDQPKKIMRADSVSKKNKKSMRTLLIISVAMTVVGIALIFIRMTIVNM